MAAGLPVVISDTDGCRETVNHEQDGLKVPVGSIRPYAEAVMRIEGDDALRSELIVNGKSKALSQATSLTRPGGKVFLLGLYPGDVPVDLLSLILKEITLDTSNCYTYGAGSVKKEFQAAIDLIAKGRVTRKQLITHTFRIEECRKALDVATHKGREKAIKVIFDYR